MNIIIVGNGKLGETLAKQLTGEGHNLTLVDSDREVLEACATRYDVMTVFGNGASVDTLRQANVDKTNLLIAATGTDEVNLLCCTTAHWLNPNIHTIARIRAPEYEDQAYAMRDAFALSMIVNPEKQTAAEIERLLKYPGFLKRDSFAKGRMEIVELRLEKENVLIGKPLSELSNTLKCHVLVCSVIRDGVATIPSGAFVPQEDDRIFVTAPTQELSLLLKNLGIVTHKVRKVMLVGGGKISYYLAELLKSSHIDVQIVEKDRDTCLFLASQLPEVSVIQGDACNQTVLESEGLTSCDALVTLTGIDEMNMVISLYGDHCGVPQIITKLSSIDNMNMLDSLPLGSIVSPRKLCCNNIVRYVRAMQNQTGAALTVHSIAEGAAEAIEFRVDENTLHCGEPLKNIKFRDDILLAGISSGNQIDIPGGNSKFQIGDRVVVISCNKENVLLQLNDIFA